MPHDDDCTPEYDRPLTEWERGYICKRCRNGFLRFDDFLAGAKRRLCRFCYSEVKEIERYGGFDAYPEIPLPRKVLCWTDQGQIRKASGGICPICGNPTATRLRRDGSPALCQSCSHKKLTVDSSL